MLVVSSSTSCPVTLAGGGTCCCSLSTRYLRSITSSPIEPLKQREPSGWNFQREPLASKFEKNCWPVATLTLPVRQPAIKLFAVVAFGRLPASVTNAVSVGAKKLAPTLGSSQISRCHARSRDLTSPRDEYSNPISTLPASSAKFAP